MDGWLARVVDEAYAGQLPFLIEEWGTAADERRWIALALRLDLAVLVLQPELAASCVHRRCSWLGAEGAFYLKRPDPPLDAPALRERVSAWPAPLTALRPPQVPLDAGVIEEYRSAAVGSLWITSDAIGVGDDIAWERATGKRIARAAPVRVTGHSVPAWPKPVSGVSTVEVGGRRFDLALGEDDEVTGVYPLDDTLVLVAIRGALDGDDYERGFAVVELAIGRVRWRGDLECDGAARVGDTLVVWSMGGRFARFDIATGSPIDKHDVPVGGEAAISPDGTIATRSEHVIRVWDLSRLQPVTAAVRHAIVQWSPSGHRLLTGTLLCDGRSGAPLATLPLTLGNWLEGGPPRNCRRLGEHFVEEIMPFGFRVWDAATGELLVHDRSRSASFGDVVAFDRVRDAHAVWHRHDRRLTVYDVRSAGVLFTYSLDAVTALGFTPDGRVWWQTPDEACAIADLATGAVSPLAEPIVEPVPQATVVDGLLVHGEHAIPIDSATATVGPDGRTFASWNAHYALTTPARGPG